VDLIAFRRSELQAEARALGHRLYAEKPKAHARRLGGYLAATEPQPAKPRLPDLDHGRCTVAGQGVQMAIATFRDRGRMPVAPDQR